LGRGLGGRLGDRQARRAGKTDLRGSFERDQCDGNQGAERRQGERQNSGSAGWSGVLHRVKVGRAEGAEVTGGSAELEFI
jgi:hypothetical protein